MKKKLILIDASGLLFRSYFAMMRNPLRTKTGIPTSAVYGFFRMIFNLVKKYPAHAIAAAFDVKRSTLERTKKFSAYKAHRKDVPEDLVIQMPIAQESIALAGIPAITVPGYEADDVLASFVKKYEQEFDILLFTGDKDLLQLVRDGVQVALPDKNGDRILDRDGVKEYKGVFPEQMCDFLAILGDSSDNIPGVKGIGEKGAVSLLEEWNSLDEIYNNLDQIKPVLAKKLTESKENALLSMELVQLNEDLDVSLFSVNENVLTPANFATKEFIEKMQELELFSLLKELAMADASTSDAQNDLFSMRSDIDIKEFGLTSLDKINGSPFIGLQIIEGIVRFSSDKEVFDLKIGDLHEYKGMLESFFDGQVEDGTDFIVFDQKQLIHLFSKEGLKLPAVDDLKIMGYLLDPARSSYSVEHLSLAYLGKNDSSGVLFQELKNTMKTCLTEEGNLRIYEEIEMPLRPILASLEEYGVCVDADLLNTLSHTFEDELARLSKNIYHLAGKEFNILSPKQLGQILFEDLGLQPYKKTKTKSYSTDSETLEALSQVHPLPREVLEYRTLSKFKSTYTDALFKQKDDHNRVHTTLHQTVTATGRLSSEDPNLQNIPIRTESGQRIREAFVPSEGRIFVSADYSQIELRLFALLSKDKTMRRFFSDGGDVHRHTAAEMFHIPEASVTSEQRRAAKTINYGISYGMSAFRLGNELSIDYGSAKQFIDDYFQTFPGVKDFMLETLEFARTHGYVQTMFGRRRPTPELYGKNVDKITNLSHSSRFAINAVLQGSAADIIKMAMISVQQMINKEFSDVAVMILQVHDELLFEVKPEYTEKFMVRVRETMESVIDLEIPFDVEVGQGLNWKEAH